MHDVIAFKIVMQRCCETWSKLPTFWQWKQHSDFTKISKVFSPTAMEHGYIATLLFAVTQQFTMNILSIGSDISQIEHQASYGL